MPTTIVIDDDPSIEDLIRHYNQDNKAAGKGHSFILTSNDEEAFTVLDNRTDIDVALVSIDSKTLSGFDLFKKLDRNKVRIPRIALTSDTALPMIRQAMSQGAADFLTKPVEFNDLEQTISRVFKETERRRHAWATEAQLAALRREVDIAGNIQRSILPQSFPESDHFNLYAKVKPAKEMSGDFYDFFEISPGKIGLVIADVAGKGVPAAFYMAVARTLIRASAPHADSAGVCLRDVNNVLCRHHIMGMFVSVLYAVLDTNDWSMTYANGGHMPPYLSKAGDDSILPLTQGQGTVLGVEEGLGYQEGRITLDPGDTLFFYTDGLTEAFNTDREQFSEERLTGFLAENNSLPVHALAENLFACVGTFTNGAPQSDDITSLIIRRL